MTSPIGRSPVLTQSPVKDTPNSTCSERYIAKALEALKFQSPEKDDLMFPMEDLYESPEYKMKQSQSKQKRLSNKDKAPKARRDLQSTFESVVSKK